MSYLDVRRRILFYERYRAPSESYLRSLRCCSGAILISWVQLLTQGTTLLAATAFLHLSVVTFWHILTPINYNTRALRSLFTRANISLFMAFA